MSVWEGRGGAGDGRVVGICFKPKSMKVMMLIFEKVNRDPRCSGSAKLSCATGIFDLDWNGHHHSHNQLFCLANPVCCK